MKLIEILLQKNPTAEESQYGLKNAGVLTDIQESVEDNQDAFATAIGKSLGGYKASVSYVEDDMMSIDIEAPANLHSRERWGPIELILYGTFEDEDSAKLTSWQTMFSAGGGAKSKLRNDHLDADGKLQNLVVRFYDETSIESAAKKIAEQLITAGVCHKSK